MQLIIYATPPSVTQNKHIDLTSYRSYPSMSFESSLFRDISSYLARDFSTGI